MAAAFASRTGCSRARSAFMLVTSASVSFSLFTPFSSRSQECCSFDLEAKQSTTTTQLSHCVSLGKGVCT